MNQKLAKRLRSAIRKNVGGQDRGLVINRKTGVISNAPGTLRLAYRNLKKLDLGLLRTVV